MRHLLLAALLVATTGCGSDTKPQEQPTTPAETVSSPETPNSSDEPSAKAVVPAVNSIGMRFVPIPAGTFMMGYADYGPAQVTGPAHKVTLTQPFELGVYEVTQEQYEKVMGKNPSKFKGPQNPVQMVSWDDAVEFCRKLSAMPAEKKAGYVYRLPTEAEWEYACRAGTTTKYSFGDDASKLEQYAWYGKISDGATVVGGKKPNSWGLYDMHGNVLEWVQDYFDDYSSRGVTDPTGPATGSFRVFRGGCWNLDAQDSRSASRNRGFPSLRSNDRGFRVCLSLSGQ